MKNTLEKICKISLSIIYAISHTMLFWIFISTVEIAFTSTINKKANDFNIFVLTNSIKSTSYQSTETSEQSYTDVITDGSEDDDEDDNDGGETTQLL